MASATESRTPNASISARNRQSSVLLRLPGELRNQIWEYALSERVYRFVRARQGAYDVALSSPPPHHLALLSTCRQTHDEAYMLPFAQSTFSFAAFDICQDFAVGLPTHQRSAITYVAVGPDFNDWGWYWFVRHMKENDGVNVKELFPNVKEVVIDERFRTFNESHPHWRHVFGLDALCMKQMLIEWLRGEDEKVETRFGVVEHIK